MADDKDNTVYIGSKPAMSYILAVVTQFEAEENDEVRLKARGKTTATAIDVAEMARNKFLDGVEVADVTIGTDTVTTDEDEEMNLSSIQIDLVRG
ncbi:MAG: DNA-binding protein Alba [Candidatus Nanohaloarchaea archaeon]